MSTLPEEELAELGGRIRYARRRQGMSQAEAAEALGVSRATVWAYERGQVPRDLLLFDRMADVFQVSATWLIGGSAADRPPVDPTAPRTGSASPAPTSGRGPWPPFLAKGRYYLVCPACGRDRLRPDEILQHLQSPFCLQVWSPEEAEEHARRAQRDPAPWFDGMRMRQARIEQAREDAARAKGSAKETIEVAIQAMAAALNLMRVSGPERFEIPESEPY